MAEQSGRCLCGAVRWRYDGPHLRNLICHCESCQRATSAPFTAFVGMDPAHLHWQGEVTHFESSPGNWRGFCPACGTRLYYRSRQWPDEIHVHAATLDDRDAYRPDAQVLCAERMGWPEHMHELPCHDGFGQPPAESQR